MYLQYRTELRCFCTKLGFLILPMAAAAALGGCHASCVPLLRLGSCASCRDEQRCCSWPQLPLRMLPLAPLVRYAGAPTGLSGTEGALSIEPHCPLLMV